MELEVVVKGKHHRRFPAVAQAVPEARAQSIPVELEIVARAEQRVVHVEEPIPVVVIEAHRPGPVRECFT